MVMMKIPGIRHPKGDIRDFEDVVSVEQLYQLAMNHRSVVIKYALSEILCPARVLLCRHAVDVIELIRDNKVLIYPRPARKTKKSEEE